MEGSPAVVAGSTVLRYNHAVIRAVLGRREEALATSNGSATTTPA